MTGAHDLRVSLTEKGWALWEPGGLEDWLDEARARTAQVTADPAGDFRHGRTWFAGVAALGAGAGGRLPSGGALPQSVLDPLREIYDPTTATWDPGQVSVVYPGYPQQDPEESEANARFRKRRDAAHVDGLLPIGTARRRMMKEPHAFVLGIPLDETPPDASPMVVWEGSHRRIADAFEEVLRDHPIEAWPNMDLTETYTATRRAIFEECERTVIHARPGQVYVIHRLGLHGVAPWGEAPGCARRAIAYFRPQLVPTVNWLDDARVRRGVS